MIISIDEFSEYIQLYISLPVMFRRLNQKNTCMGSPFYNICWWGTPIKYCLYHVLFKWELNIDMYANTQYWP